jgi:hypothetical protein
MSNFNTPITDNLWGGLMDACKESGIHSSAASKVFDLLPKFKELERNSNRFNTIRELMGYIQDGSHSTVTLYQDDATGCFTISVGNQHDYGSNFNSLVDSLRVEESIPF